MLPYAPLGLAFAVFAVFLAHALVTRIGRMSAPLRRLGKNHLLFSLLYLAACPFVPGSWAERAIGLYVYLALQYPFFFVLFGQVSRGFSMNLCVTALRSGGVVREEALLQSYGDGKGIEYVKSDRLKVMFESGVALREGDRVVLTRVGRLVTRINRILLALFALDYLGREAKP